MIDLDKMAAEARARLRQHINRSAAAHLRVMRRGFHAQIDAITLAADPQGLKSPQQRGKQ